jgi:chromate transporter
VVVDRPPHRRVNTLTPLDWWALFAHFLSMSMLAIGGAIAVAPEIHRFVVEERHWIDDTRFTAAVALAQAAPGPNLLFVPVLGHAIASRWGHKRRETRAVRAFVAGMAPVTIGLLIAAGTVLAQPFTSRSAAWVLIAATVAVSARWKVNPVWLIAVGAAVGAAGLV